MSRLFQIASLSLYATSMRLSQKPSNRWVLTVASPNGPLAVAAGRHGLALARYHREIGSVGVHQSFVCPLLDDSSSLHYDNDVGMGDHNIGPAAKAAIPLVVKELKSPLEQRKLDVVRALEDRSATKLGRPFNASIRRV